jgi:hypothetical protein
MPKRKVTPIRDQTTLLGKAAEVASEQNDWASVVDIGTGNAGEYFVSEFLRPGPDAQLTDRNTKVTICSSVA